MKCPNCGSENCHFVSTTETRSKGFSLGNACCGSLLMGPVGIVCGLCGASSSSHTKEYWICNSCGSRFSQSEAEEIMKNEAQRLKEFLFYRELQKKSVVEPFETKMGERILQGIEQYLKDVFIREKILVANPLIEDPEVESLKYGIGKVLTDKELVYLVLPSIRLVIAEKGLIFNNTVHTDPAEFRFYKNHVYFGQNFITTESKEHAEKLCGFFEFIYSKNDSAMNSDGGKMMPHECEDYQTLLTELQNLREEPPDRPEHFSSQEKYAKFVKGLREKSFQRFLGSNTKDRVMYEEMLEENSATEARWISYTFWSVGTAALMFMIQWFRHGFFTGILGALIITVPFWVITIGLSLYKDMQVKKILPDHLRAIIEEDEKENIEKTGRIRVLDHAETL